MTPLVENNFNQKSVTVGEKQPVAKISFFDPKKTAKTSKV